MDTRQRTYKSYHLVGILGIGMSALAQYLKWHGYAVSGSDRAVEFPENAELVNKLKNLGIEIFKQDGSFILGEKPDYIVYSSAIEDGNPDFAASEDIKKLHRTEALVDLFSKTKSKTSIAVAGTCGKTSVSSILSQTFNELGLKPLSIIGGFVNSFSNKNYPGNFKPGGGTWLIYETDESDKSLLSFKPDYSILLNIGKDHYSKDELIELFENFLKNTKHGAVIEKSLLDILDSSSYSHLKIIPFSSEKTLDCNVWQIGKYKVDCGLIETQFLKGKESYNFNMPVPGRYNASNFLSALALYELISLSRQISIDDYLRALSKFNGVHRRFEYMGTSLKNRVKVYCDFAHNPEKISSSLKCAQDLTGGRVFVIFQSHGYKPLGFMADDLYKLLEKNLRKQDLFIFLPVYYSGGTSSFKPKASDVAQKFRNKSNKNQRYLYFENRKETEQFLEKETGRNDIVLIMGARDNSLPEWSKKLVERI